MKEDKFPEACYSFVTIREQRLPLLPGPEGRNLAEPGSYGFLVSVTLSVNAYSAVLHMERDDDLLPEAFDTLAEAFSAEAAALVPAAPLHLAAVKRFLEAQITALLDRNPTLLMHILYRVDVAEAQVMHAFANASPARLPGELADLLIERQLQKVRLRRHYRGQRRDQQAD